MRSTIYKARIGMMDGSELTPTQAERFCAAVSAAWADAIVMQHPEEYERKPSAAAPRQPAQRGVA